MRDEVKMDANRLIAEVHKRPALWNQRHISYHNREVTNRVWMEIASIFKLPKPVLKAKWKGLRDTFRAELKKEQVYRKSKYQRNRPLWIHFESLQFLKEQMLPRPPIWDRSSRSNNYENDYDGSHCHQNGMNGDDNDYERDHDDSLTEHLLQSSLARSKEHSNQENDVKAEPDENVDYHTGSPLNRIDDSETMLQSLSPEQVLLGASVRDGVNGGGDSDSSIGMVMDPHGHNCDDNYYFLMSLLPHMKQLSPERRMFLRMKIQELVYEEVYKKNSIQENATSS
ncbi:uncharacterized protein LOC100679762 [Nasonia vitripennis]|uniref:Transcription factor Adf-1 n=1 Tax=Nasonia vitripennis TaxID=7425 RepID=A0A7M7Q5T5_NASVI|nr:uncharacterized protein LOC100679762 [Nasonia vitripennis]